MDLRASILCLALPFGRVLPTPDSTIDQKARQQVALCYTEILAAGASVTRTNHYAESNAESTTTSTSPQDKTTLTFTPDASSTYYILAAYQLAASASAARVDSKFINDTAATTLSECSSESTNSTDYFSISGASIETFGGSPASQTYKIQYDTTNASWSAKVQNARIIALKKISGDENAESLAEQTNTTATLADACTLTFTPSSNGRYLIIATCDWKTSATGVLCRVALDVNGTEWARTDNDSNGTADRHTWGAAIPVDLTSGGSRTIKIQFSRVTTGTAYVYNCRIIALRLDTFAATYDGANQTGATTTSSTYQDFLTETNTVNAADHLTIASAVLNASSQTTTSPTGRLLNHDGSTADVETVFRSRQPARVQSTTLFTFRKETLTSGSKSWKIQYKSPNNANTIGCDESAVSILQLASGGVTGSATITQGANTAAGAGVVAIVGSLSTTQGAQTTSAAGAVAIAGAGAVTQDAQTLSAAGGTGSVTGSLEATQDAQTVSSAGAVAISGAGALVQAGDTLSATGVLGSVVTGAAALTQGADSVTASGNVAIYGAASLTQGGHTVTGGSLTIAGYATITATSDSAALTLSEDTANLSITRN